MHFSDFRFGLQSPKIEEFAICPEVKVNTNLAFTVHIVQHSREYNECIRQNDNLGDLLKVHVYI